MTEMQRAPRPWNVTVVGIVGIILTAIGFLSGLGEATWAHRFAESIGEPNDSQVLRVAGIFFACVALIALLLWILFLRGSNTARLFLTFFVAVHIVWALLAALRGASTTSWVTNGLIIVAEIVILIFMFAGEKTIDYFEKKEVPVTPSPAPPPAPPA